MRRFALLLLAALVAHGHRLAPRIDSVTPSKLTAGSTQSIEVEGKNIGIDVTLSFGKDVTIIGAPLFMSPTHATMKVTVAAAAKQGGVAVVATNAYGSNSGPGTIYITSSGNAIHLTRSGTKFDWSEDVPGTATFFLFELLDESKHVSFSVQTKRTTVVIDSEKLAGSLYARVSGYAGRRVVETSGLVTLLPRGTGEKILCCESSGF